jgi:hypothetical protein
VKFKGKNYFLGTYDTQEEAADVADLKRRELMPHYVARQEHSKQRTWDHRPGALLGLTGEEGSR